VLSRSAWISLDKVKGAVCLPCADLDHLEFLPTGDAALTRRARQASALWAVVLKWSRSRRRYERQGLLVEHAALASAELACIADAPARAAQAQARAEAAQVADRHYVEQFAEEIRRRYPACPAGRERPIAEHACRKYSDRIGRTSAAKSLDGKAIDLAVLAHIRHAETDYDRLLTQGMDRHEARSRVAGSVEAVARRWLGETILAPY
jgi:hypothetical protein